MLDVGKRQSAAVRNRPNKLVVFDLVPCICLEMYPIHQPSSYAVGTVPAIVFRQDDPIAKCGFDNTMRANCCSDSIFSVKSNQRIASSAGCPCMITKAHKSCIAARERCLCIIVQAYGFGIYTRACGAAVFTCIQNLILVASRNDSPLLSSVYNLRASAIRYYSWCMTCIDDLRVRGSCFDRDFAIGIPYNSGQRDNPTYGRSKSAYGRSSPCFFNFDYLIDRIVEIQFLLGI